MNPIQMINQIMNSNTNNPVINNAIQMYKAGNEKGLQNLANNICQEKGIDINKIQQDIKRQFNL